MPIPSDTKPHIHAPRFWPTWAGLALLRGLAELPMGMQLRLGSGLGELMYRLMPSRRRIAAENIRLSFPTLDSKRREELVRETFRSTAVGTLEGGLAWWGRDSRLRPRVTVEGLDRLEAARAQGKGVILLGGHYTTLEISGRLLSYHVSGLCPVYKPARNAAFEAAMARSRRRTFDELLPSKDLRTILRALRRGKVVWYAPDQDFGRRNTVFAPFMGVQAASLTITGRLAAMSGAPVLPFYSERRPDGRYRLRVGAPLPGFPSMDAVADASAVNAAIETQVRRAPAQYLWVHKRFRSRPPGLPPLYGKK